MKSLFKLSFICLLTFFATNALHAQCSVTMSQPQVMDNNSTAKVYYMRVTTPSVVDRIVLEGVTTCYDTNICTGYAVIQKRCYQKNATLRCQVIDGTCNRRDGCVVVIEPLSNCGY